MAASQLSKNIQDLRRILLYEDGAGLSDGQLLEQFVEQRDEAAIAALVRRHSALVWGLCRRVVGHHHDAEDERADRADPRPHRVGRAERQLAHRDGQQLAGAIG